MGNLLQDFTRKKNIKKCLRKKATKKSDISLSMELFIRRTFLRKTYAFLIPRLNTLNSYIHTFIHVMIINVSYAAMKELFKALCGFHLCNYLFNFNNVVEAFSVFLLKLG